jgi:hypothetical protein
MRSSRRTTPQAQARRYCWRCQTLSTSRFQPKSARPRFLSRRSQRESAEPNLIARADFSPNIYYTGGRQWGFSGQRPVAWDTTQGRPASVSRSWTGIYRPVAQPRAGRSGQPPRPRPARSRSSQLHHVGVQGRLRDHGSHVAGIAAADTDNGSVAGVGFDVRMVNVRSSATTAAATYLDYQRHPLGRRLPRH